MDLSEADMESRKRMAKLKAGISEVVAGCKGLTYAEAIIVLTQWLNRLGELLRRDDLKTDADDVPPL